MENISRTANIVGAMCLAISDKLNGELKEHSRQNDTSIAALNVIGLSEGLSNGQLGATLGITHSATVRLVDKLVEALFAEVRPGLDKRTVAIFLTDAGRTKVTQSLENRIHTLTGIVAVLSKEQREQLDSIAETLLGYFTETPEQAMHVCRLCEMVSCPLERCPAHLKEAPNEKILKPGNNPGTPPD